MDLEKFKDGNRISTVSTKSSFHRSQAKQLRLLGFDKPESFVCKEGLTPPALDDHTGSSPHKKSPPT